MINENKRAQSKPVVEEFVVRYFLKINRDNYVIGMFVAVTAEELAIYLSDNLIEVAESIYQSVGPDSKFIDGEIVQGELLTTVLSDDAKRIILAARQRSATDMINTLQDVADLYMATNVEKALLLEWRKYRVLLNRTDPVTKNIDDWPVPPATKTY